MPKTVKGAHRDFLTSILLQNFKKMETLKNFRKPFGDFEKFPEKNKKNENF